MSKEPIGLIQLVSEEAMPSLFPILALKPTALVHVTSQGYERHSEPVLAAAALAHLCPPRESVRHLQLPSMPSITETHQAVMEGIEWLRARGAQPVINFTGGTKLMSIGSFYAAVSTNTSSLYVDGARQKFVDGGTGPEIATLLVHGLDLLPLGERLSVPRIAAAHGCEMIGRGLSIDDFVPLSRHLLKHPDEEQSTWKATQGAGGAFAFMERQRSPRAWAQVPTVDFALPPTVFEMALAAGLVERHGEKARIRCNDRDALVALERGSLPADERWRLIGALQARVNFFGGGWWEVAVADAVIESRAFRDVRWGAELAKHGQRKLEEDVLAVQGVQLAYFSCKRGDPKRLMRQLEEMDASARRLGGRMVRKYFCACHLDGRSHDDVKRRAEELHVQIVTAAEVQNFPDFLARIAK